MKKLITSLLLISMLASLAACASDNADSAETTAADAAAETTANAETEPPEYTNPGVDLDGAEFVIAAYPGKVSTWKLGEYSEALALEENGDPINDAVYQRNRAVEEELNVKIGRFDISALGTAADITKAILSGDDMFKIATMSGSALPSVLGGGMLTDLYDLTTFDLEASWWDQKSAKEFDLFGTAYAVTGDFNFYNKGAPICNFFSKKLVEDLILDDPYTLVRDGKWTIDKMIEYATAAARDLNGDGQMIAEDDCWGFMSEPSTASFFIRGANQRLSERTDDDIKIIFNTEKTATVVEKIITLMRNKSVSLYSGDHSSNYSNVFFELFLPKFTNNEAMFYSNQILVALNLRNMDADFGILPLPKYDEAQDEYVNATNNWWHTFTFVPMTNGELDMTGIVLNALGYYSQQIITPAFIDQTVMSKAIRDNDSAEMIEMIYDTQDYDIAAYYNWGSINSLASTLVGNTNTGFASEYAKIEPNVETKLAETIAQLKGE